MAVPDPVKARRQTVSLPAPTRGLVLSQSPAAPVPQSAEVMENVIPTDRGVRVRGGLQAAATTGGDAVTSLFIYNHPANGAIFAASASNIYDVSAFNPSVAPLASVTGQTAGYYSTAQIGTVGGDFLYAVNGADLALIFDGTDWNPVNAAAVRELAYDGGVTDFTKGETVTGGTSGASATILMVIPSSATAGVLKIGAVTAGPFQDNEALTSAGGEAVANGADTAASSTAITGVTTSTLSAVWLYRSRLFFVQKNTLTAWYLGVDSIAGAANSVSLAGVFQRGGSLLFGATWSLDSGDGLDDKCVFVSTEGEVAIFSGSDPSDAATWALEGRYDVAKPLGINGTMQAGGDLLIATVEGIVPLSQVIQKDPAALSLSAVSRPIEPLWAFEARRATSPVEMLKWPDRGIAFVTLPEAERMLVVNLQTGAWASETNWIANCGTVFLGKGYIGRADGSVVAIDETGFDVDEPYTARLCLAFEDFGDPTTLKLPQLMRMTFFAPGDFIYKVSAALDYNTDFPSAPNAAGVVATGDFMVWDVSNWDEEVWWTGSIEENTSAMTGRWLSVSGAGYAVAPQLQITSGQATKPNIELVRVDMTFQTGGSVV